jgi:hypothetical protein
VKDYKLTNEIVSEVAPEWSQFVGRFQKIWAYNFFGDLFLQDPENNDIAILYTVSPELIPTRYSSVSIFIEEVFSDPEYSDELLQPKKSSALINRLGSLNELEVYIAEPYLFLGGDGSIESYSSGNIWVYLDIIGQLQEVNLSAT